ncbi:MAG TPA: AAA family ATPase, partial [Vicinamibacteria bacterium]|nr:AAA family ATPase [Vicinamibacteria bacterium]
MLTRLEADGFKNLLSLSVEFGPLTCLAGPNAVGKSNVFDAIHFLSLLADTTLMDAALGIRGTQLADVRDLFWTDGSTRAESFQLAAEMIVDEDAIDDFGRPAKASSTFLRYEVEIGYEPPGVGGTLGRLVLRREALNFITEKHAAAQLRFPHSAKEFRKHAVNNRRRAEHGYISTDLAPDGQPEILVHQDGGSRGNPQRAPAVTAPRTVLSTSNTSSTPTVLAARREMQKWRILALEPTAMRSADSFQADPHVTANGD